MSPQREHVPADQEVTDAVWRREACFYCGDPLDERTAMEVGQRMVWWQGRRASILPRRHPTCGLDT